MKHLIDLQSLNTETIAEIFQKASEMKNSDEKPLEGKILATLFYEPSTRTRLSFEAAMIRRGGKVVSTENARDFSSAAKGESLEDTIRVVAGYVDAIVLRHNDIGAAERAARVSNIPIINAGDGAGQHPSQALLDLYTILLEIERIDNITIAMVGDLKYGRTVRSLCYLLGKSQNIKIIFISPDHLAIGDDIKEYLVRHGVQFEEQKDLDAQLPHVDIVYMTRTQTERVTKNWMQSIFSILKKSLEKPKSVTSDETYAITPHNLGLLRENARLLHPLPHLGEINLPLETEENDPRVGYFRQAQNGLYIRMALLSILIK